MFAIPYFSYTQFNLGVVTFYSWGFFLALAFLFSMLFFLHQVKKEGNFQKQKIEILLFLVILGALFGSRLGHIIQYFKYYSANLLEIFYFWEGGMMIYGGLLGALVFGGLYLKKFGLDYKKILDITAPSMALGIFIGRIGCSLINDHQGAETALPWAIEWTDGVFRHPVAEYLALNALLAFFVFWWLLKKGSLKKGYLFLFFVVWYSLSRFLFDFTRVNSGPLADPHFFGLTASQWLGVIFLLIVVMVFLFKKARKDCGC